MLVRDKTITVRKSEGMVPDYSIFRNLVDAGAFCDPKLVTQVMKSGDVPCVFQDEQSDDGDCQGFQEGHRA